MQAFRSPRFSLSHVTSAGTRDVCLWDGQDIPSVSSREVSRAVSRAAHARRTDEDAQTPGGCTARDQACLCERRPAVAHHRRCPSCRSAAR
eukprot:scaffold139297_cov151-Phaeocystis_antarctica.AAC.1